MHGNNSNSMEEFQNRIIMQHLSIIDSSLFTKLWVSRLVSFCLPVLQRQTTGHSCFQNYTFPFVGGAPPPTPACTPATSRVVRPHSGMGSGHVRLWQFCNENHGRPASVLSVTWSWDSTWVFPTFMLDSYIRDYLRRCASWAVTAIRVPVHLNSWARCRWISQDAVLAMKTTGSSTAPVSVEVTW